MINKKSHKYLITISMFYMALMIFSDLLVNKPVSMFYGYTTAATLIFPIWFILNDVIAEVYGYYLSRSILLTGFIIQLFFNLISYYLINLPSPSEWHNQEAFNYIIGALLRIGISTFAAFFISGFINIKLLLKWKKILSGKYFWLRSIGASFIGETAYSLINVWMILLGSIETSKIPMIMLWSFLIKIFYTSILVYPATYLVYKLKLAEGLDLYEEPLRFQHLSFAGNQ